MKSLFYYIFVQLALIPVISCGQGSKADSSIINSLKEQMLNNIHERAYLQFDKPYYAGGDTMYFKAYVTKGGLQQLTDISGVLHVQIINTNNKVIQFIKLPIDSGVTWGDFTLPDSLPEGNYTVRAFTNWMRNNNETDFFERVVPFGTTKEKVFKNPTVKPATTILKPDIQFFPEGGKLITGVLSKVAFKAVGTNGLGVDLDGSIVDDQGKIITSFSSGHLGMGYFYLKPLEGENYAAKITYHDGQQEWLKLPKADANGLTLSINNDSLPKATVTISASDEFYHQNRNKKYTLIIYSVGLITTVNCKLDSSLIKMDILKRKLRTGVSRVTLFSQENEPLCERLFFVQNFDQLTLNVNPNKK